MTAAAPSWNAQRAAESRAVHQLLDHPRVFDDPLAVAIAGGEIGRAPESLTAEMRHRRALMAARSRYAEDELNAAVARGATQYVILGAGLDTYGYRNGNANARVFEVDHSSTQAWKRARLRAAGIAIPPSLVFVPAGFDQQSLPAVLRERRISIRRSHFLFLARLLHLWERASHSRNAGFYRIAAGRKRRGVRLYWPPSWI